MKSINTQVIINRIGSRVDGSIGISMSTPELNPSEKALFFELHNINCEMTLKPLEENVPEIKIDREVEGKSQSQRMRNVLWRIWEQEGKHGGFDSYYNQRMELMIEKLKEKLD